MDVPQTLTFTYATHAPLKNISFSDNNLYHWIFKRVRSFVIGRVMEVSTGTGNIAAMCQQEGIQVLTANLDNDTLNTKNQSLVDTFDTVIALDMTDQIANNPKAVANYTKFLKEGGHLLLQIPAHTALYKGLEQGLEHWKKYNWQYLRTIIGNDYEIIKIRYFIVGDNVPSIFKRTSEYRKLVSVFNMNNAAGFNQKGLSIIVVGKKCNYQFKKKKEIK